MACLHLLLLPLLLTLVLGQELAPQRPPVLQISEAEFARTLSRQLPNNRLLTANPARAARTMMALRRFVTENGCDTHVCFALDGGVFVDAAEYSLQQDFATLVGAAAGADPNFRVAAVQYGLERVLITAPLTSDVDQFLIDIDNSVFPGATIAGNPDWRRRSRRTFRNSLRFCIRQVESTSGLSANKIIFLGDVRSPRAGARLARRFLPPNGDGAICAVGFGGKRVRLERFTGDANRVLGPEQSGEVLDILEDVVRSVCGAGPPQRANAVFTDSSAL